MSIQKAIAYFDASYDLPEEIVMAAGFIPIKILGNVNHPNDPADQYLSQMFCPQARSFLTEALESPNKWEGIVVAHGCDATNREFDVWKMHVKTPWLYWFNNPMKTDKSARKFFRAEILAFIDALQKQYKVSITDDKMKNAIKISNELKKILQEISKLRIIKDIPNRTYFEAVKKAVQMDKESAIKELKPLLSKLQNAADFPANKKRVFLTGSDVTYVEWMDLLEECNLRVVRDDLSIGERYFSTLIPILNDSIDSIIEHHLTIPRPSTKHSPDPRLDYILKGVKESQPPIAGVISQNVKFCEPYAIDSLFIMKGLKDNNIQAIHLERDFAAKIDQQLKNRLEAFKELLK
jgi:benzoyl-CoA reductase/2-hydroxyglutaryl-CoA dehydratase subunit BcrC/BadD/HgdB